MDTVDSIQGLNGNNNQPAPISKVPLFISILLLVFILVSFILIIYIITQLKDIEEKEDKETTDEKKEESSDQGQVQGQGDKTKGGPPIIGFTGMRVPNNGSETINMTEDANTADQLQIHYIEAIERVGGIPVSLPVLQSFNPDVIKKQIELVDALVIQGGLDVDPSLYGNETRDEKLGQTNIKTDKFILESIKQARERKIPILGICRGLQILNVYFNGTLHQDLPSNVGKETEIHHQEADELCEPAHNITIIPNTLMASMFPTKTRMEVNSWHHQAIKELGNNLAINAKSDDNITEAIQYTGDDEWIFAVQFHPEQYMKCGKDDFIQIFIELIKQAIKKRDG